MRRLRWTQVLDGIEAKGWTARVLPVERLDEARARVAGQLTSGALPKAAADHLMEETVVGLPPDVARPRSVVIAATRRALTQAVLVVDGAERIVPVPPHYAGYRTAPRRLEAMLRAALAPQGFAAALCAAPLKTLAVGAGLARYGRNNIAYVPGLGSYLLLAACVSDAPPPDETPWSQAASLARCEGCAACVHACPSGAVRSDRFLLQTERCLTFVNESEAPLPDWVEPTWHTCAVGCLRCQQACPENAAVGLRVDGPQRFDETESAAILCGDHAALSAAARARLVRCGLDYSASLLARNLQALLGRRPAP
jgi:epoxyqueuosine reductase